MINFLCISSFLQGFGFIIYGNFFSWTFLLTWSVFCLLLIKHLMGKRYIFFNNYYIRLLFLFFIISFVGYLTNPTYYMYPQPLLKQEIIFLTVITFILIVYSSKVRIDYIMKSVTIIIICFTSLELMVMLFNIDMGYSTLNLLKASDFRSIPPIKGGMNSVGKESSHFASVILPISWFWLSKYIFDKKVKHLVPFLVMLTFLYYSSARSAYFASSITLLVLFFLFVIEKKLFIKKRLGSILILFLICGPIVIVHFWTNTEIVRDMLFDKTKAMGSINDVYVTGRGGCSNLTRYNYVVSGFDIYADNVLFGTGFGMSRAHYPEYYGRHPFSALNLARASESFESDLDFDNLPIRILAETGTIGAILFILFFLSIYVRIFRIRNKSHVEMFLFLSMTSMFGTWIGFGDISSFWWWFIIALALRAIQTSTEYNCILKNGIIESNKRLNMAKGTKSASSI